MGRLVAELNYNVMFSQRGVLNLGLKDMRDIQRRVNANRLNGIDSEVLDTQGVQEIVPHGLLTQYSVSSIGAS